ncbi:hypothetical protein [Haladaptatus sp. NG-SE-30]
MSTEQAQLRRWFATHPWLLRFVGIEALFLVIAYLSLTLLGNDFGGLFYAMSVSLVGFIGLVALVVGVSRYVTGE